MARAAARGWRRRLRRAATVAGIAAGGATVGSLGMAYYVARALTAPVPVTPTDAHLLSPFETGAEYEDVTFPSEGAADRVLHGWWYPRPETSRVVICCPGYRGTKSDLIGISYALWRAGFNVLTFDFHGHGADHGAPVTLAYREVRDLFGALDYAHTRVAHAQIGVIGFSMGAAVTILAAARRQDVRAVVADSPFATHEDVVAHAIERVTRLPGRRLARLADTFLGWRAGYRHRDVRPVAEVAAIAPRPLLLIHGAADRTIPVEHAYRVYEAAGAPKELWIGEGADHCGTYFLDRPGYCARVAAFFERAFDADTTGVSLDASARAVGMERRSTNVHER
jgi:fermentation-respiration switch protein FrsA (DUF1100 family)